MRIAKLYRFEAAHYLPGLPPTHQCSRMHGHSYQVEVVVEGQVDTELGWVVDFAVITDAWKGSGGMLDHSLLNDLLEIPTAENIALYLSAELRLRLESIYPARLVEVSVWETATSRATWQVDR